MAVTTLVVNVSFQMPVFTYKYTDLGLCVNPDYVVVSFLEELTFLMVLLVSLLLISITLASNIVTMGHFSFQLYSYLYIN